MNPTFTVVIPTCRRPEGLAACLDRIANGTQSSMPLTSTNNDTSSGSSYEVIVTDDGGDETTHAMVRVKYPWARWVEGPRRGPAANRNHGARQARGEWLVFTDDDCLPEPGWLEAFQMSVLDANVLEGRTIAPQGPQPPDTTSPINEGGGKLWSCNFAIRAALFQSLSGFEERFPFACMEDSELKLRLDRSGEAVKFVPEATVLHPWRRHGSMEDMKKYRQSIRIYLRIHPEELGRINTNMYAKLAVRAILKNFRALKVGELVRSPGFWNTVWMGLTLLPGIRRCFGIGLDGNVREGTNCK